MEIPSVKMKCVFTRNNSGYADSPNIAALNTADLTQTLATLGDTPARFTRQPFYLFPEPTVLYIFVT